MVAVWINKQNCYWVFCLNCRLEAKQDRSGGPNQLISRLLEARLQSLKYLLGWFQPDWFPQQALFINHANPRTRKGVEVGTQDPCCEWDSPLWKLIWIYVVLEWPWEAPQPEPLILQHNRWIENYMFKNWPLFLGFLLNSSTNFRFAQ